MLLIYFTLALLVAEANIQSNEEGDVDDVDEVHPTAVLENSKNEGIVCEINPDPAQEIRPSACCKVGDILPVNFKAAFKICEEVYPFNDHESYSEDSWSNWVYHTACLDECIWIQLGMIDKHINQNKQYSFHINKDNVRKVFTDEVKDEQVREAVNIALDNCFAIYNYELNEEENEEEHDILCKSQATELLACYMKEVFLNCPTKVWNKIEKTYEECEALWNKINVCANIHVMLHGTSPQQENPSDPSYQGGDVVQQSPSDPSYQGGNVVQQNPSDPSYGVSYEDQHDVSYDDQDVQEEA